MNSNKNLASFTTNEPNIRPTTVNISSRCKLLLNTAPSFALAPRWNNIPETFLFNIFLGMIFYIVFTLLTRRAWSKKSLIKEFVDCSWIEFLYGYRDPERWVAMPRFEFIHRAKKHHIHEPDFPFLYISPRLIAYDPNSILRKDVTEQALAGANQKDQAIKSKRGSPTSKEDSPESPGDSGSDVDLSGAKSPATRSPTAKVNVFAGSKIAMNQDEEALMQSSSLYKDYKKNTSERLDFVSSSALRSRPLSSLNPKSHRANLNLRYSEDPLQNPQLAAELNGQRSAIKSAMIDNTDEEDTGANSRLDYASRGSLGHDVTPHANYRGVGGIGPANATNNKAKTKRSRLELRDDDVNLNIEDLHLIITHLERANWLTKKLNKAFNKFSNITDLDLIYCKGIDAYEYLLFQRHMILLLVVINILCLGLILPIHLIGDALHESGVSFRHTTIVNLSDSTMLYWAHIVSSFMILITAITLLGSYKSATITKNDILVSRRTLLVGRLNDELHNKKKLRSLFSETFPECNIESIQYVYDTKKLEMYQQYLESVIVAREYCDLYKKKYNKNYMIRPTDVNESHTCKGNCRLCSCCLVCACYWPHEKKIDGSQHYATREKAYRLNIDDECRNLVRNPFEAAFITFKSHKQTKRIYSAITSSNFNLNSPIVDGNTLDRSIEKSVTKTNSKNNQQSTNNNNLRKELQLYQKQQQQQQNIAKVAAKNRQEKNLPNPSQIKLTPKRLHQLKHITVRYAPHPDNVEYHDLLLNSTTGLLTQIFLNLLMIVLFLFLSTPTVVFKYLEQLQADKIIKGEMPKSFVDSSLANYAFVLLQVLATVMLPTFILLISQSIPYNDSASKNHSIMWKVFLFTMLMVMVLPSFGLTTLTALIMAFVKKASDIDMRCIFPTDNGAFFVNYIISSTVIPPFMELLKPSDIVIYFFMMATSRSKADFEAGRQFIGKEFPIGIQYTKFLLNLAVVFCYCISVPLIAPFGLMYMLFKYQVDKYNLYYTYYTSKVDRQTQRTVEVFIRLALVLMLLQSSLAISINTGIGYFAFISQVLFWFSFATFVNNCLFDCTSNTVLWQKKIKFQREFCACFYLPRVIEDLLKENAIPSDCTSFKT